MEHLNNSQDESNYLSDEELFEYQKTISFQNYTISELRELLTKKFFKEITKIPYGFPGYFEQNNMTTDH